MCEMALWMAWHHRGKLVAQSQVELLELDVPAFHAIIKHRKIVFRHCLAYAENYMAVLLRTITQKGLFVLNDLYGEEDALAECVNRAHTDITLLYSTMSSKLGTLFDGKGHGA
eukprot:gnl/TRDRNA2_/TRDRNA2_174481_c0_seq2.p2 gnl/TRDRNA2_/TRDRNA2_174481_c0~~gnl/TRDRNA2_/TRDRNA2_174481_c0_seq2.p2  ORF type:complete len:113 (-),score=17.88 gnl/TRDRNA2_/TRDRNA2_174481_c0_seq2:70-408(-)